MDISKALVRAGLDGLIGIVMMQGVVIAAPTTVNIQGNLERDGEALTGQRAYRVRVYDASFGGSQLGGDLAGMVQISDAGRFSIAFEPPPEMLSANGAFFYELAIDSALVPDGAINPEDVFPDRVEIHSVPFALRALDSDLLGGTGFSDYATDTELANGLDAKADLDHDHDDRYYTETELNTSGGGGEVHWDNVTNKPSGGGDGDGHSLDAVDGSPVDAVFVDSEGRVGVGTATPEANLHILGTSPADIILDDPADTFRKWRIRGSDTVFSIDNVPNLGASQKPLQVEVGARDNSLVISDSNESFSPGSQIGIGTADPEEDLHIVGGMDANILLENNSGATRKWRFGGSDSEFCLEDIPETAASRKSLRIEVGALENSLVISASVDEILNQGPRVGIGTEDPEAELHILGGGTAVAILLDTIVRAWRISAGGGGLDITDLTGDGENPVSVLSLDAVNGDVGIGDQGPDADLDIQRGTVWSRVDAGEPTFSTSSSRDLKENIQPIKEEGLLEKVAQVPVNTYDWKNDGFEGEEEDRTDKIGLIAEDFHTILGRGSNKEIKGEEVRMVLWLAVQELHKENESLKQRLNRVENLLGPVE